MNHHDMEQLAQQLIAELSNACHRIEIKGSICRGKPEPGDIDIVCVPITESREALNLFGEVTETVTLNYLDNALDNLYVNGQWQLDMIHPANGEKCKRIRHVETGVACDLYITDADRWGMIATIRTGSAEFNVELMKFAKRKGFVNDGGRLYRENRDGSRTPISTPEEADVFSSLSLPWIEPQHRTAEALRVITN